MGIQQSRKRSKRKAQEMHIDVEVLMFTHSEIQLKQTNEQSHVSHHIYTRDL